MATADIKALTRRMYDEVFNEGKVALIDELMDERFVEHEEFPGLPPGREGVRAFTSALLNAFPDLHVEVEEILAAEDGKVVGRVRFQGTHEGEFVGIAPTGNKIDFAVIDILRWSDGKAVEHWAVSDQLGMLTQLGVIDQPA